MEATDMRVFGPDGFRGAAFVHDGKVISATKNLGPCANWSLARFERMCAARGWRIERDELPMDGEPIASASAGDR
jgi:hypothetical protein